MAIILLFHSSQCLLQLAITVVMTVGGSLATDKTPIPVGSQLQLMVEQNLVSSITGDARLMLHHPVMREVALQHDAPWEGSGSAYHTVFRDGDLYRMYYRGAHYTIKAGKLIEPHKQFTCYAESRDGIHWEKPNLGLFDFNGSKENNIIWASGRATHNFAPFKDTRADVAKDERYKALAYAAEGRGIGTLASADGIHWRWLSKKGVITNGAFDSHNIAFWDEIHSEYRAYYRDFRKGYRDIRTATSKDFITWSEGQWLDYGDSPREQLYTNAVQPYERAPHLLIGLPARYKERSWSASMKALPDLDSREQRSVASKRYGTALSDTLLMASHDGVNFRRWDEAFIRPGPERPGTWNYGHLFAATGLVETKAPIEGMPNELSIYANEGKWTGTGASLRRYTLRIDGFVSIHAGTSEGEMRTKLLTFKGKELALNFATSAAGSVAVAIHDANDKPIKGFGLNDCEPLYGDSIERVVTWKDGKDLSRLVGQQVRLRFVMKDADLYSFKFR